jgi:RNA polymerase sigma factor (sigma-70 family)
MVLELLESLPEAQRHAIGLRYGADLSFRDVGQALGKSEAAAKMLVQRGLETLRDALSKEGGHS